MLLKMQDQIIATQLDITAPVCTFSGLIAGAKYDVIVYTGTTSWGFEQVGTVSSFTLHIVSGLSLVNREGSTLTFGWTAITGKSYKVTLNDDLDSVQYTSSNATTFIGLSLETIYTAKVYPEESGSYSTSYSEVTGTTYGSPATNVRAVASTSDSLVFAWSAPPGAISFNLNLTGGMALIQ